MPTSTQDLAEPGFWRQLLDSLTDLGPPEMSEMGGLPFFVLLGAALASAFFVSFLYTTFYASRATGSQIHRAFPLLSLSITAIFISIQFSLPLSLGLLGALSIVRFRTPIKEPEEIGFLMLVIATSLCCATANLFFIGILLSVAVVGLVARRLLGGGPTGTNDGLLTVVLPLAPYREQGENIFKLLGERFPRGHIDGVIESGEDVTLSFRFRRLAPEGVGKLQNEIAKITPEARTSVFFLQSGGA